MTNIAIEDLTTIKVDGTGAFDSLMQATKNHLQEEYKAGRIKGTEYSQVYLGSLVAVMDQAVKFLGIQQQDKLIAAQIQEIEARKALIEAQRDNAIIEGQNLILQGQLIEAQKDKTQAEIILVNAQKDKLLAEIPKVAAEIALIENQILQISAQVQLTEQQRSNLIAEALNIPKQGNLLDKQVTLMDQKTKTEEAQIKDIIDGQPVVGIIGKQKTLYERQADGFLRDAEHKMAKLMADVWAVQRTTDEGFAPSTQLANASIDSVITKAKQGVGV